MISLKFAIRSSIRYTILLKLYKEDVEHVEDWITRFIEVCSDVNIWDAIFKQSKY